MSFTKKSEAWLFSGNLRRVVFWRAEHIAKIVGQLIDRYHR